MRMRPWGVVAILVVLGGAAVAWQVLGRGKSDQASFRTEVVHRGDIRVQVSATGTLSALTTVQVGSQVSGTIASLFADFNDQVRAGQVLAQLDPTFLKAQVAQSDADLERSNVQVRQAERDYARLAPMKDSGLASQAEIDAAETAVEAARATVKASEAALDRARTNLRYATITSPIDGVVVSRDVDVGQTVAASLSAPTLFTIANDLTRMQLEASVDEADIGMIQVGQAVRFTVDAHPDRPFSGEVRQIRLAPQTVQNVVSYTVIVSADNSEQKLLPGMTANATFLVHELRDVLRVPNAALRFRPPPARGSATATSNPGSGHASPGAGASGRGRTMDSPRVFVLDEGGTLRPVGVVPGLTDGTFTAVESDSLREGMAVVVGQNSGNGSSSQTGQVNPFMPNIPGGARRGR